MRKPHGLKIIKIKVLYRVFSFIRVILICSIPVFNFIFALILIFAENKIIEKTKELLQKESKE